MYKDDKTIEARRLSHSELAMRAAKGMRRSRHKEKTGRVICQHLLKMLAQGNENPRAAKPERRGRQGMNEAVNAVNTVKEPGQMPLGF